MIFAKITKLFLAIEMRKKVQNCGPSKSKHLPDALCLVASSLFKHDLKEHKTKKFTLGHDKTQKASSIFMALVT